MNKYIKTFLFGVIGLTFVVTLVSCSKKEDPQIRVRNELTEKANIQIQTSGGNTININEVLGGQTTVFQTVAEGDIISTAVIQKITDSPKLTFFAAKEIRYTIVIKAGTPPTLRVLNE